MAPLNEVEIRRAEPEDEAAIRRCVEAAYSPYTARMGKPPAPMLDDYADLIARGVVQVAELAEQVVGLIVMWPKPDHFYIDNIAVDPAVQGSGAGAALLAHADDEARRANRNEIRLYTNVAMVENLDYYPRRGFRETHRATDSGYERIYFARTVETGA